MGLVEEPLEAFEGVEFVLSPPVKAPGQNAGVFVEDGHLSITSPGFGTGVIKYVTFTLSPFALFCLFFCSAFPAVLADSSSPLPF